MGIKTPTVHQESWRSVPLVGSYRSKYFGLEG
jgi:hypothetical protein